jgi:hypothetical protein
VQNSEWREEEQQQTPVTKTKKRNADRSEMRWTMKKIGDYL